MHDGGANAEKRAIFDEKAETTSHFLLGRRLICLVFSSIFSCFQNNTPGIAAPRMAVAQVVLTFVSLCGFCLGFASLGNRILRALHWEMASDGEHVVVAIAVGLISTEILLFLILISQHIRQGCLAIVVLLCGLLLGECRPVWERVRSALGQMVPATRLSKFLLILSAVVAFVEFLASQAPLTGSDALYYHFTVQKQILQQGFHPIFSNSHSFLCGQHHLLILLGLALGNDRLALGFIFLGGILTTASLACLICRWASGKSAAAFCLLFLLTPVVFWQISSSGAPDIFMAFLACAAVLVLRQEMKTGIWQQILLAGFLAGGIAGAKYIGCMVVAALGIAVVVEFRSAAQVSLFFLASLFSGIWPYMRNLAWTRNPVFPFFSARLSPHLATTYALSKLTNDTETLLMHDPWQLIPFVFLAAVQKNRIGFWDFFGPTVLALAPLILLVFRNTRAWRIPVLVWFLSSLGIFFSSGLPRFLLPVFPIALSCIAVGFEGALRQKWSKANRVVAAALILMILAGAGGLVMYSQRPVLAAIGWQNKTEYLQQRAPDYEIVQTVNRLLRGRDDQQRVLVFVRHLYYLDFPYLNGDPGTSFELDPEHLQTTQEWKTYFEDRRIRYVVRSPSYPDVIAGPLTVMEREGDLVPFAQAEVQNFQGKRINDKRVMVPVVILEVQR